MVIEMGSNCFPNFAQTRILIPSWLSNSTRAHPLTDPRPETQGQLHKMRTWVVAILSAKNSINCLDAARILVIGPCDFHVLQMKTT